MRSFTPLLSVLAVVLSVCTAGCKKTDNASPPAFLQVGHQWVYLENTDGGGSDTLTVLIKGTDPENEFVVVNHRSTGDSTIEYWYMDGNYVRAYPEGYPKQQATSFWNISLVADQKWVSPICDSIGGNQYDQVIALNVGDTAIAGVFNTTQLQFTSSNINHEEVSYISNDAGEVKRTGLYTLNLISKNF